MRVVRRPTSQGSWAVPGWQSQVVAAGALAAPARPRPAATAVAAMGGRSMAAGHAPGPVIIDGRYNAPPRPPEHVDVLIVGAGIPGSGAARHLEHRLPGTSYVLLEA